MIRVPLTILGKPVPKQRPRFDRRSGRTFTPAKTRRYEAHVAGVANLAARRMGAGHRGFFKARIRAVVEVYFPDRRRRDVDNVAKSVLDGIQRGQLIADDLQVDELTVRRHLDRENPRVEVLLETIPGAVRKPAPPGPSPSLFGRDGSAWPDAPGDDG